MAPIVAPIALAQPLALGNEAEYLRQCVERRQFSGGEFLRRFEQAFAGYIGVKYALATSSGTTALHLALLALDIGPGDEVLVPDLTYVATANAVTYCGATPVLVDVELDTWTIDPIAAERAITGRTKAILPVHLYGLPANMGEMLALAARYALAIIEDSAEALGATWRLRKLGGLGDVGCFSFYGNKTITTGEGGMVVTNRRDVAERVHLLRGQGQDPERRYWHTKVGYNYRMSELQAAVGLAQMEDVEHHVEARRTVARWYREVLPEAQWHGRDRTVVSACWMNVLLVPDPGEMAGRLAALGIETRPVFTPLHLLPMYAQGGASFPVSEHIWRHGLCLPSHGELTPADVRRVCEVLA